MYFSTCLVLDYRCESTLTQKWKLWVSWRSMSHLGDLWDLGGVNGPTVFRHGHSVPGLFSLHALVSLFSLFSWIYEAKDTHTHTYRSNTVLKWAMWESNGIFIYWSRLWKGLTEWHFWLFLLYVMKYCRSANRWEGVRGFLSAVGHNSISAGYRDRKSACMLAGFLSHCSYADVTLSRKEDLNCRPDLAVSCCPWRAAAGALFSAPPALQSSPPCGSARWFLGPGRLSWTPSCAERITRTTMTSELNQAVVSDSVVLNRFSDHFLKCFQSMVGFYHGRYKKL